MAQGVSVIICCYNSSKRLDETLAHMSRQQGIANIAMEVILVDNCSTDDTVAHAKALWKSEIPLRIVTENEPGLSSARKAGILAASYDYILFCDDDNWLDETYISNGFKLMTSDKTIGVCGGHGIAVFEDGKGPEWFKQYEKVFACGEQPQTSHVRAVYGAGMFAQRDILLFIINNYQFVLSDRKGNQLTGGNDYEIVMLIGLFGYSVHYLPALTFRHYMPEGRMKWEYLKRIVKGSAISSVPLAIYNDFIKGDVNNKSVAVLKYIAKNFYEAAMGVTRVRKGRDFGILYNRFIGMFISIGTYSPDYNNIVHRIQELNSKFQNRA
jgi:glycosyltransferase involved in cell wall biosynthesis